MMSRRRKSRRRTHVVAQDDMITEETQMEQLKEQAVRPDEMMMDRKPEAADMAGAGRDPAEVALDAGAEPVEAAVVLTRRP